MYISYKHTPIILVAKRQNTSYKHTPTILVANCIYFKTMYPSSGPLPSSLVIFVSFFLFPELELWMVTLLVRFLCIWQFSISLTEHEVPHSMFSDAIVTITTTTAAAATSTTTTAITSTTVIMMMMMTMMMMMIIIIIKWYDNYTYNTYLKRCKSCLFND